jgi:hypothetical protein
MELVQIASISLPQLTAQFQGLQTPQLPNHLEIFIRKIPNFQSQKLQLNLMPEKPQRNLPGNRTIKSQMFQSQVLQIIKQIKVTCYGQFFQVLFLCL